MENPTKEPVKQLEYIDAGEYNKIADKLLYLLRTRLIPDRSDPAFGRVCY